MQNKVFEIMNNELKRQQDNIELIASENFVSENVLKATGSILTNKYAEGYPEKRYYSGCDNIDEIENIAIESIKKLFNCKYANVQSHSGSSANLAAYLSVLEPGDNVLAMDLNSGGHLTHGYNINFSGHLYNFTHYGVDKETELIDYDDILEKAKISKPKLIVAGASNYSREIDFSKFRRICDEVGALLMCDVAHIAGLIVAGQHPSPFPYADIVTSTTHKTLRGPRGAIILSNSPELAKKIDRSVFPGSQGGPLEHVIAGKAISFLEALEPSFIEYQIQTKINAKAFSEEFIKLGCRIVSGGTDNHLFTLDVESSYGITGKEAEERMEMIGITANKNTIPYDQNSPFITSGVRIGTPAMTTRGLQKDNFVEIAHIIDSVLKDNSQENITGNTTNSSSTEANTTSDSMSFEEALEKDISG